MNMALLRSALQICHYLIWFPLAVLVISAIIRCGARQYPLVFTYMMTVLLAAVAELPSSLAVAGAHHTAAQVDLHMKLYAAAQCVTHLLIFAVVASFVLRATEESRIRHLIRTALAIAAPSFIAVSFLIHYSDSAPDHNSSTAALGYWMTPWIRDINFGAAIVDMILWGLLLSSRKRSQTLLLLVGGVGITFAGDAISDAIRSIAIHFRSGFVFYSASAVSMLADGGWLYVWWQAFRRAAGTPLGPRDQSRSVITG